MVALVSEVVDDVRAQLHRNLVVGMTTVPARDRKHDGLEIDVRHRMRDSAKRLDELIPLDEQVALAQTTALARGDGAELEILRQILDPRQTIALVLHRLLEADAIEMADVIVFHVRPAAIHERARPWLGAMAPDCDLGLRSLRDADQVVELALDEGEAVGYELRDVLANEEIVEVRVRARAIEVHDLAARHWNAGAAKNESLQGDIGDEVIRHRRLRFHFDQSERASVANEDVGEDQRVVRHEPGFEDDAYVWVPDGRFAFCEARRIIPLIAPYQQPAGKALPREGAHFIPLIEQDLRGEVDLQLFAALVVDLPPHPLRALHAGDERALL